jgi:hypothetical protein
MARNITVVCGLSFAPWTLISQVALSGQWSGQLGGISVDPHAPGVGCIIVIGKLKKPPTNLHIVKTGLSSNCFV